MIGKDTFLVVALLLTEVALVQSMQSLTFSSYTPTVPLTATKTFTTSIRISTNASTQPANIDNVVFLNATASFYSTILNGYISSNISSRNNVTGNQTAVRSYDVTYEVMYNYSQLVTGATGDENILTKIGNVNSVRDGLEQTMAFANLYNVSNNDTLFSFKADRICPSLSCGSQYVYCTESAMGIAPTCRSICFSSFACENNGVCVHKTSSSLPVCNCQGSSSIWYLGARCEYMSEVWMVAVFIVGFLLLVAIICFIGFLCCKMRRHKAHKNDAINESPYIRDVRIERSEVREYTNRASPVAEPAKLNSVPSAPASSKSGSTELDNENENAESVESAERSSENQRDESGSLSSDAETDREGERYDMLQFSNTTNENSTETGYEPLNGPSTKGTQTRTMVDIELPESILMSNI